MISEKNYEEITNSLKNLREVRASDGLKKRILLLAKHSSKRNSYSPAFLFTRSAIVFSFILLIIAGGGIYASEKSEIKKVVEPIKEAALNLKTSINQTKEFNTNINTPSDQSDQNGTENSNQNIEESADVPEESQENSTSPTPTEIPSGVLSEVSEKLPEPAKSVVEDVSESLTDTPSDSRPENKPNNQSEENTSDNPNINIEINIPENPGGQNSNNNEVLQINLPF